MNPPSPSIRYDVVALGELVIDMIPAGTSDGEPLYAARPGGAPGNVAAGIARLGLRAGMLSKVGLEPLGDQVVAALASTGVDVSAVRRAPRQPTALAVVSLDAAGDRGFTLFRGDCADATYAAAELDTEMVRACRLLHVGSLSLGAPASATAHRLAVETAREAGALISTDPNFRPMAWDDPDAMLAAGREAVASADIVKLGLDELALLAGCDDPGEGVRRLWHPGLKVAAVTRGQAGADIYTDGWRVSVAGFAVAVADTVGCGDAFMAALIAGLLATDLGRLDPAALTEIGRWACAAGAIVATRSGAMTRMPSAEDIEALLAGQDGDAT